MVYIIKKDGTKEEFDASKIKRAVNKSAGRVMYRFTDDEINFICKYATDRAEAMSKERKGGILIQDMHNIVEGALEQVNPAVAKSYRDYRNYKVDFIHMMDEVYTKSQSIRYIGDKSNANTDSALVATKRSLIFNELNKELYRKFFMNRNELQACKDGYIYIHDQSARLDTMNCCLFDVGSVLRGGFEMGNVWYNEPKTLDTAFDVMGDIILSTAAQQYGGFTVPEVDKILSPYAQKSYNKYYEEFLKYSDPSWEGREEKGRVYAWEKVCRDCDQGWQGIEYKLNTVGSSRGDYPFVTVTLGLGTGRFEKMISKSLLKVHMGGQGKAGHKKPVLFPKIVFLYDEEIHGDGKECEDVFETGVACSAKTMYPDWLSMSGQGYISSMYKKYKKVISPMGCRAFLSPWYERGGMEPADENDVPVFVGRFNIGAVSLHLPMILAKARAENTDFYEVLDFYLEMIRGINQFCNAHQYVSTIVTGRDNDEILAAIRLLVSTGAADAFILLYSRQGDTVIDYLVQAGLMYVLIGKAYAYANKTVYIDNDNFLAGQEATEYLIRRGHRRIAYLGSDNAYFFTADRRRGYQAALALADIPLREDYCVEMPTLGSDDAAVHALLSRADRPTAIVVSDDLLGMTLGRACLAHGLSIPKDISIISFNNSLFAKLTSPRLTSVDLNSFQLGIEAASQLISHVERPELMATKSIIPHRIVERESCRDL